MLSLGNLPLSLPRQPTLESFRAATTMPLNDKLSPAIRDARRDLFSKIRNDWTYPDPASPARDHPTDIPHRDEDIQEWRERTYASSDPSSDEDEDNLPAHTETHATSAGATPAPATMQSDEPLSTISIVRSPTSTSSQPASPTSPTSRRIKKPHLFARTLLKHSPSRSRSSDNSTTSPRASSDRAYVAGSPSASPLAAHFEAEEVQGGSGAAVDEQAAVHSRKEMRKQRRRLRFEQEMQWNEGLRYWAERRDAWTRARRVDAEQQPSEQVNGAHADESQHPDVPAATQTDASTEAESDSSPDGTARGRVAQHRRQSTPPRQAASRSTKVILPVAPPLLPQSDPTRATFDAKTQTYTPPYALFPSLYSKVVIQSLTPSVPINLSTLIGALVDGWRRDGEWPPKSDVNGGEPGHNNGDAKKRGRRGGDVEGRLVKAGLLSAEDRESGREGRIKRGVEKVKRGLGIGGE